MEYPIDFHELCKLVSPWENADLLNNIPLSLTVAQWDALNGVIRKYSQMVKKEIEGFSDSEEYSLSGCY